METPENFVRIDYADGFYRGEVAEDGTTEHGYGSFFFNSGNLYIGEFRNGRFNGHGRYAWADGKVYEGDFLDDTISGKGTMTWPTGEVYEGDFANGQPVGQGKMTWPNGDRYEGGFVDGKMEGEGTYYDKDGSIVYSGPWVQGCAVNSDDKRLTE